MNSGSDSPHYASRNVDGINNKTHTQGKALMLFKKNTFPANPRREV